jgi:micrococcal nuclease
MSLLGMVAAAIVLAASASASARVDYVVDGDTIALRSGPHVRLVQIDTPEVGTGECYSRRAAKDLRRLLPDGTQVELQSDPRLDSVDRYGRLLRYVFHGSLNVNLRLVEQGDATVWFYHGDRGRYASELLAAARRARAEKRGVWGTCHTIWNPYGPATTSPRHVGVRPSGNCDPSYPGVCIPPPPPDLDCADVKYKHFRVVGRDPHHFDGDHDGIGCE